MMKNILRASFLAVALCLAGFQLAAQSAAGAAKPAAGRTSVVLEFFDDDRQIRIFNADGFEYGDIYLGMELVPGDRVQTLKSSAELRLNPNGSIIKVTANTNFQINGLKSGTTGTNDFALLSGKIRTVAAKTSGTTDYRFKSPTAVAGVRGTDFGMEVVEGKTDRLVVREGLVDFTQDATGKLVNLASGMSADTFAPSFEPLPLTTQEMAEYFKDVEFIRLNPAAVPSQAPEAAAPTEPAASPAAAPSPVPDTAAQPAPAGDQPATPAAPKAPDLAAGLGNELLESIKRFLGIEIGTVTIGSQTYGKFIAQPKVDTKDFKAQFYIPVIYQENLFDPTKWYKPAGNNEWSFGTDQGSDVPSIVVDVLKDLALKIKYIQLFNMGDPFFLKVGNVPSMTLGHGSLINGYANDADFPAVRRLGVNTGFDVGQLSLELLVNDLTAPEIFGTRLVWRPVAPSYRIGAGISAALDIAPAGMLSPTSTDATTLAVIAAQPAFINMGADLEIPIISSDIFGIMVFGDFGTMLPYFGKDFTRADGTTVAAGAQFLTSFATLGGPLGITINNYGFQAGIQGNVFMVDYRVEYQYFRGTYQPGFYDKSYDRTRGLRAMQVYSDMVAGTADTSERMGIYGSAGFTIERLLRFDIGYKWPWTVGMTGYSNDNPDSFMVRFGFEEDALPFGIGFSIGYERQHFVPMFTDTANFNIIDQYAVFKGALSVPVGNFFKLRATVGTAASRDANGDLVMQNGTVVMKPTFTIESVF